MNASLQSPEAMTYIGEKRRKTANGFIQTRRLYQAMNCEAARGIGPATKRRAAASFIEAPTSTATPEVKKNC